jgi:hypothetical protein
VAPGGPTELNLLFDGAGAGPRPQPKLAPLSMPPPPRQTLGQRVK